MSKIIYIAGLGHSGSTLLDMSLGTLPGVYGMGEIKGILDEESRIRHFNSTCSCGKNARECEFWKDVPDILDGVRDDASKFEVLLQHVQEKYGKEVILVDSSKNSNEYLKHLDANHDLKLIYLTRDVRSWSYARHLSSGKPLLYFFARWYFENWKLLSALRRMKISPFFVGYEEIALYPEHLMKDISNYCELSYSESMCIPDKTSSHIISGNIARVDTRKREKWMYDARWMVSFRMILLSPLLGLLFHKNKRLVYSNIKSGKMQDFYMFGTRRRKEISKIHN